jgi:hypothetical protein
LLGWKSEYFRLEHAPLARITVISSAIGILALSMTWTVSARACLLSVEHLFVAIASEMAAVPREARFECLHGPSVLNGRTARRTGYHLAPNGQSLQQRPVPSGSGRGNNVADLVPHPTIAQTIRSFLGQDAIEAIHNLYIAIRPDSDRVAPDLEAANHDREATDRENAAQIYEDVAAIEGRMQLLRVDTVTEDIDLIANVNPDYAVRVDDYFSAAEKSNTNHFGLGNYVVIRTDTIQVADLLSSSRSAGDMITYSFEAENYNESSASWPNIGPIYANSSGQTSGSGAAKATDGRPDFVAFIASLERLIFSTEAIGYLIVISMLYLGFEGIRKVIRASRRPRRRRLRNGRHRRA